MEAKRAHTEEAGSFWLLQFNFINIQGKLKHFIINDDTGVTIAIGFLHSSFYLIVMTSPPLSFSFSNIVFMSIKLMHNIGNISNIAIKQSFVTMTLDI